MLENNCWVGSRDFMNMTNMISEFEWYMSILHEYLTLQESDFIFRLRD
nr:integrase core domain protein [Hymenolepis microstoma]